MHIDSLPPELLALILARLTNHQRLNYASLTSKRWRIAALCATTSLAEPANIPLAAQLLTRLECLQLTELPTLPPGALPHLRSLTLALQAYAGFTLSSAECFAAQQRILASLVARASLLDRLELIEPPNEVLRACASAVSALRLRASDRTVDVAASLTLPRLTSLFLTSPHVRRPEAERAAKPLAQLLAHTHTQLEALSLRLPDALISALLCEVSSLHFPRLTRLDLLTGWNARTALPSLVALPARCHPAVAVSLRLFDVLDATADLRPLATALTDLTVIEAQADPAPLLDFLALTTSRLTSITLFCHPEGGAAEALARDPALATKLTDLTGSKSTRTAQLTAFPCLSRLSLSFGVNDQSAIPCLPSLTQFTVSLPLPQRLLPTILHNFPALRILTISLASGTPEEIRAVVQTHANLEKCAIRVGQGQLVTLPTPRCALRVTKPSA